MSNTVLCFTIVNHTGGTLIKGTLCTGKPYRADTLIKGTLYPGKPYRADTLIKGTLYPTTEISDPCHSFTFKGQIHSGVVIIEPIVRRAWINTT